MTVLTENGSTDDLDATHGTITIGDGGATNGAARNNLGGGTVTLEYLQDKGDASVANNWHPVNDTGSGAEVLMQYTTAPQHIAFNLFSGVSRIRATLSGATTPNVEINVRGHVTKKNTIV